MTASSAREEAIEKIRRLPHQVEELISGLSPQELTAKTLLNEWTVAQNVHHLADSHINSYVRCKLMATEDNPTLKPYDEGAWALLSDGSSADLSASLALLKALHARWILFWQDLPTIPGSAPASTRRAEPSPSPGSWNCTSSTVKPTWNRSGARWPHAKSSRPLRMP